MNSSFEYKEIDGIKCYSPKLATEYNDYPSSGFDVTFEVESKSFWVRSRARIICKYLEKLLKNSKSKFLEIGCGTGYNLSELSKNNNFNLTGSEVYLNGLKYAKSKLPQLNFIQLDATHIPFHDEFDIIGSFDVLEHIEEDQKAISGIYQALNKTGYFILTVPQYMFLWSRLDEMVNHKRRYSRIEIRSKLEKSGFKIVFLSSFVFVLFPLMLIQRLINNKKNTTKTFHEEFTEQVYFPPWINWIFDKIMKIDEFLILKGLSLPFGGSLFVVAQKC